MGEPTDSATLETRDDAGKGEPGQVKLWVQALALAEKDEKDWTKGAENAIERMRDEKSERAGNRFNILYSSTMTLAPALYSATPSPDVRRRFRDKDPIAAKGAQVIERGLVYSIDCGNFDYSMQAVVYDSVSVGRGVSRVRYVPRQLETGEVAYEEVNFEYVKWRDFRRGTGRRWEDVPWVAFRHRITRDQAVALNKTIGATVKLDWMQDGADGDGEPADIFKRLTVWEIWDKARRKVLFIAPSYDQGPLAEEDPFCNFRDFFPIPRPLYDIKDTNSLVPKVPYSVYEDQAKELDDLTARISALVKCLRWRGYRGHIDGMEDLATAADGDLLPIKDFKQWISTAGAAGLDSMFFFVPIEKLVVVIKELVVQREQLKQTIFELTGVADVMRGQTNPNETLGAQQLKAQWGSIRMQDRQKEVQRFARDQLRLAAEIISEKFEPNTLFLMTGIDMPMEDQPAPQMPMGIPMLGAGQPGAMPALPGPQGGGMPGMPLPLPGTAPQAAPTPSWASVIKLLRSDASRMFRIDIETDSTIQPDQIAAQKMMSEFVSGSAQFFSAVGSAVKEGAFPQEVALRVYASFARQFKLGRQAEDALDSLDDMPQQPKQQQPDPAAAEAAKAKVAADAETTKHTATLAADAQRHDNELKFKSQEGDKDRELKAHLAGAPPFVPGSAQASVATLAESIQQLTALMVQIASQQQAQGQTIAAGFAQLDQVARSPKKMVVDERGPDGRVLSATATPQVPTQQLQ